MSIIIKQRKNEDKFSLNTLFFLYYQLKSIAFVSSETDSYEGKKELWSLYKDIIDEYDKRIRTISTEVTFPLDNKYKKSKSKACKLYHQPIRRSRR